MNKVLLIEDNGFLVRIYRTKLEKEGFQTVFLENGVGVEDVVKKEKPDVIVLDLVMPVRDGFETLRGLKADNETKSLPVIVLTALNSNEDKRACMDMGAVEYLEKDSVSIKDVVRVIRQYAGGK